MKRVFLPLFLIFFTSLIQSSEKIDFVESNAKNLCEIDIMNEYTKRVINCIKELSIKDLPKILESNELLIFKNIREETIKIINKQIKDLKKYNIVDTKSKEKISEILTDFVSYLEYYDCNKRIGFIEYLKPISCVIL